MKRPKRLTGSESEGSSPSKYRCNKGEHSEVFGKIVLILFPKLPYSKGSVPQIALVDKTVISTREPNIFTVYKLDGNSIKRRLYSQLDDGMYGHIEGSKWETVSSFQSCHPFFLAALQEIKEGRGSFHSPSLHSLCMILGIDGRGVSGSNKKDDVVLLFNGTAEHSKGYSFKSELASRPSMFNASGVTHWVYEIIGFQHEWLDGIPRGSNFLKDLFSHFLPSHNCFVQSLGSRNEKLRMKIGDLSEIAAELMLLHYQSQKSNGSVWQLAKLVAEKMGRPESIIKRSLLNFLDTYHQFLSPGDNVDTVADPSKQKQATDGLIIVREDGTLFLHPFYKSGASSDYVYSVAQVDTPSTKRHDCGYVYPYGVFPNSTFVDIPRSGDLIEISEKELREKSRIVLSGVSDSDIVILRRLKSGRWFHPAYRTRSGQLRPDWSCWQREDGKTNGKYYVNLSLNVRWNADLREAYLASLHK